MALQPLQGALTIKRGTVAWKQLCLYADVQAIVQKMRAERHMRLREIHFEPCQLQGQQQIDSTISIVRQELIAVAGSEHCAAS